MTGNEIKRLRKRLKMTQFQLAVAAKVSLSSVCNWERGTYMPSRMALAALERLMEGVGE